MMHYGNKGKDNLITSRRQKKLENIDSNKRLNRVVERRYNRYDKQKENAQGYLGKMQRLEKRKGYNYQAADRAGIKPDSTGHYPSIGNDGLILKAKHHPSMIKTKKAEKWLGNKIVKRDGERYSVPKNKKR